MSLGNIAAAFYHGFKLDISMVAYVSIIPILLWISSHFTKHKILLNRILKSYNIILLVCLVIITIADGELYQHWGQKLNAYASSFAKFPKEMLAFSTGDGTWKLIMISIFLMVFAYCIYHFGMRGLDKITEHVNKMLVFFLGFLLLATAVISMRGGLGKSPLSQSSAFFSNNIFLNHIALNTSWNLLSSFIETSEDTKKNPFVFTSTENANKILNDLSFAPKGNPTIFKTPTPNIVIIILEGWTADVIESVGGEKNITPNFNALSKEGLLFDQFYANGNRTDKGLAAIISSQPALPNSSIINNIQKFTSLPSISASLKTTGYNTTFIYGGDANFANMKGYFLNSGYEKIIDLSNFPIQTHNAEWGVHDNELWAKTLTELNTKQVPFFATVLTLSSHEPFNVPEKNNRFGDDEADRYRNSVWYSDKQLGQFFEQAKLTPWYANTVFFILSDHGHKQPNNHLPFDAGMYHIPFLIVGGGLKNEFAGVVNHSIASQVDIASTLLNQLNINSKPFNWSHNFLDSAYVPYATFVYHHGVGIITPKAKVVYSNFNKFIEWSQGDSSDFSKMSNQARAHQQLYYDEFMKR